MLTSTPEYFILGYFKDWQFTCYLIYDYKREDFFVLDTVEGSDYQEILTWDTFCTSNKIAKRLFLHLKSMYNKLDKRFDAAPLLWNCKELRKHEMYHFLIKKSMLKLRLA